MCLGIPGEVIEMATDQPDVAVVDVSGARRRISLALLDDIEIGDWVLIHVGFAMARIDEDEARAALELLAQLGEGVDDILGPASATEPTK